MRIVGASCRSDVWSLFLLQHAVAVRVVRSVCDSKTTLFAQNRTQPPKTGLSVTECVSACWRALTPLYTCVSGVFAPSPRSSADRAEDFPTTYPAPTSHYLQGNGGEVLGRAIRVR